MVTITPAPCPPEGVEVTQRQGDQETYTSSVHCTAHLSRSTNARCSHSADIRTRITSFTAIIRYLRSCALTSVYAKELLRIWHARMALPP